MMDYDCNLKKEFCLPSGLHRIYYCIQHGYHSSVKLTLHKG